MYYSIAIQQLVKYEDVSESKFEYRLRYSSYKNIYVQYHSVIKHQRLSKQL